MPTPSDSTDLTPRSPEAIRLEMKSRFDAVNAAAEKGHQQRRDASNLVVSEENKRWLAPQAAPDRENDRGVE
jgi:hypothetical protein